MLKSRFFGLLPTTDIKIPLFRRGCGFNFLESAIAQVFPISVDFPLCEKDPLLGAVGGFRAARRRPKGGAKANAFERYGFGMRRNHTARGAKTTDEHQGGSRAESFGCF